MTGVELIVAALVAGATVGAKDVASAAVRDAYIGLRDALHDRFAGHDRGREALDHQRSESGEWQAELARELEGSGAARDPEILDAAQRLLALIDAPGSSAGKYRVDLREAKGVQVGDHATQHNTFS